MRTGGREEGIFVPKVMRWGEGGGVAAGGGIWGGWEQRSLFLRAPEGSSAAAHRASDAVFSLFRSGSDGMS